METTPEQRAALLAEAHTRTNSGTVTLQAALRSLVRAKYSNNLAVQRELLIYFGVLRGDGGGR